MILRVNDRIRNRKIDFWDKFSLSLRYDAIASSFAFEGYFNPENPEHKEIYCVGHYHLATVEHNNERLITGYILSESFNNSSKRELTGIGGYALPGFLEDCQIPLEAYPLQNDTLSLRQIAEKLLKPFKLKMIVHDSVAKDMDVGYDKTTAGNTQTVKAYLTDLAAQRNILISHDAYGNVLFTRAATKKAPILHYGEGTPFTKMNLVFPGQQMHSHITVVKQADKEGGNTGQETIQNPYVPFVYRPRVAVQDSGDDVDTMQAAKNLLCAELKNFKLVIETDRWELNGTIIKPNNTITVINPEIYLFKKTTWFIEQVDYVGDAKKTVATLHCVLPEVYNNEVPPYIFKGINLHG